ncbi:tyrosine-type recombinase/integrase [Quadrisphaera sp. KR29]|uniref:tyrosine-type recombinase/integrase n=1 Tax=Quadrisphaera sp. KR29 TaxID=3461391 RepID=UPI004043AE88
MASVSRRKGETTWQARYRDESGKQVTRRFARKVDAQRWIDEVTTAVVSGQYVDPKAGLVPLRDYAEAWRKIQAHRPTTVLHVETTLRRHIYPTLGHRPIAEIRPSEVQALVKKLSEVLQPTTIRVAHRYLSSILNAAVADRLIAVSPCKGTRLPKAETRRLEPLPTEAVHGLISCVPDRYSALIVLAAGTGMRQGEVFGLTVDRIDFLRRRLLVDQQLVLVPDRAPYLAPPKTAASVRTIPLPDVVLDALSAHIASYPSADPRGLVFTTAAGEGIRRTKFSDRVWRPAVRASSAPTGTTFHELRHYYASLLIRHCESVKTVQARLGHASAAETLDTYSHLWPDSDDRTRQAVDEVLLRPSAPLRADSATGDEPATGASGA